MSQSTLSEHSSVVAGEIGSKRTSFSRVAEYVVGAAFVGILVYVVLFAVRVADGVTRDSGTPAHAVRLQVLNGAGVNGLAGRVGNLLNGYRDAELDLKVVEAGNFEVRPVTRSFIVSREADLEAAQSLARKLGLSPSDVIYEPLTVNNRQVSVSLVLGLDYGSLNAMTKPAAGK